MNALQPPSSSSTTTSIVAAAAAVGTTSAAVSGTAISACVRFPDPTNRVVLQLKAVEGRGGDLQVNTLDMIDVRISEHAFEHEIYATYDVEVGSAM